MVYVVPLSYTDTLTAQNVMDELAAKRQQEFQNTITDEGPSAPPAEMMVFEHLK